jgi:hypothetical protein
MGSSKKAGSKSKRGGWKKRHSPEQLARQARKEAEWRALLDDWRKSGLDGRSYARSKGISEHIFYSWKRTIRLRDEERRAARDKVRSQSKRNSNSHPVRHKPGPSASKKPPLFLPVNLKSSGVVEIRHASGHTLILHEGCSSDLVGLALAALES